MGAVPSFYIRGLGIIFIFMFYFFFLHNGCLTALIMSLDGSRLPFLLLDFLMVGFLHGIGL